MTSIKNAEEEKPGKELSERLNELTGQQAPMRQIGSTPTNSETDEESY